MTCRQKPHRGTVAAACLFAGIIGWGATPALASDYPPPPGPYPSGTLPMSAADDPVAGARPPAATPPASADRRAPLLPAAPEDADRGMYGATNLFGSAPPPAKPAPPPAPVFAPTAAVPPQTGAATGDGPERRTPRAPVSPYPSDPEITPGSDYRPPAYPLGRGFPPNAGPGVTQPSWRGQPETRASAPPTPPAGEPLFRPQGD